MKNCPKCGNSCDDAAVFCNKCGTALAAQPAQNQAQQNQAPQYQAPQYQAPQYQPRPVVDLSDHTAEFDRADISENKVFAMLPYLMGMIGIIIALLANKGSKFIAFHVRQALMIEICVALSIFACVIPILGWIVFGIVSLIALVLKVIGFVYVAGSKAKEIPIVKSLSFMK